MPRNCLRMSSRLSTVPAARASTSSRLNSAVFSSTGSPRQVTLRLGGEILSSPNTSSSGAAGAAPAGWARRSSARARATSTRGSIGLVT